MIKLQDLLDEGLSREIIREEIQMLDEVKPYKMGPLPKVKKAWDNLIDDYLEKWDDFNDKLDAFRNHHGYNREVKSKYRKMEAIQSKAMSNIEKGIKSLYQVSKEFDEPI